MKKGIVIVASVLVIGVITTMGIVSAQPEPSKEPVSHAESAKTVDEPSIEQKPVEQPETAPSEQNTAVAPAPSQPTFEELSKTYDFGLTAPEYFPPVLNTLKDLYPERFTTDQLQTTFARIKEIFSNTRPQAYPALLGQMRNDAGAWEANASPAFESSVASYKI